MAVQLPAGPGDADDEGDDRVDRARVDPDDGHGAEGGGHHVQGDLQEAVAEKPDGEHDGGGGEAAHHAGAAVHQPEQQRGDAEERQDDAIQAAPLFAAGNVVIAPDAVPDVPQRDRQEREDRHGADDGGGNPVPGGHGHHQGNQEEGVARDGEDAGEGGGGGQAGPPVLHETN